MEFRGSAFEDDDFVLRGAAAEALAVGFGRTFAEDLLGGTDPKVLAPQVQKATSAGIKVIASHYSGFEQPLPGYISGAVPIDYLKSGELLADWAIWMAGHVTEDA